MMIRTADNSFNRSRNLRHTALAFVVALLLGSLSFVVSAHPTDSYPAGVRNSSGPRHLNESQLQLMRESLRQKSGFVELEFDRQGWLTLGNRGHIAGGSATARALLAKAVDSANLYELESHKDSPEIAFARIVGITERQAGPTSVRTTIHLLQLDFADFDHLDGARQAKASFDIGIALLHELVHGVLKLQDPSGGTDQIGECDSHVNQMRRELQLPERLYYQPGISVTRTSVVGIVSAKLVFVERTAAHAQPSKQYSLTWLASQVSPSAQNIAGLQQGLLVARSR